MVIVVDHATKFPTQSHLLQFTDSYRNLRLFYYSSFCYKLKSWILHFLQSIRVARSSDLVDSLCRFLGTSDTYKPDTTTMKAFQKTWDIWGWMINKYAAYKMFYWSWMWYVPIFSDSILSTFYTNLISNGDRQIKQSIRITSRPSSRIRKFFCESAFLP